MILSLISCKTCGLFASNRGHSAEFIFSKGAVAENNSTLTPRVEIIDKVEVEIRQLVRKSIFNAGGDRAEE